MSIDMNSGRTITPVSYTHLDVYKRQTLLFMGSAATKSQVTKVTVRSISGNSKEEVENIDNAKYRITYEGKWVNNPSIKPCLLYTSRCV